MLRLVVRFEKEDSIIESPSEINMIIYGKSLLDIRNQGHKFITDYNKQAKKRGLMTLKKEVYFDHAGRGNVFD